MLLVFDVKIIKYSTIYYNKSEISVEFINKIKIVFG